jgi:photosystem II stability/assembly factor-like uncharacterized protein
MSQMKVLFLLLIMLLSAASSMKSQWIQSNINNISAWEFANLDSTIFVSAFKWNSDLETTLYTSTDNGFSWNETAWNKLSFGIIGLDGCIFATDTGSGIYSSLNRGFDWIKADNGIIGEVMKFRKIDNVLFAASDHGIWFSIDDGYSWKYSNIGVPAVSSFVATTKYFLFVSVPNYGVYKTRNGIKYALVNNGLDSTKIRDIFSAGEDIFVQNGIDTLTKKNGSVSKTTNYGESWSAINDTLNRLSDMIKVKDNIFAAVEVAGVIRSLDGGKTWTSKNDNIENVYSKYKMITSGPNFIVGSLSNGIFVRPLSEMIFPDDTVATTTDVSKDYRDSLNAELYQNYPNPFSPSTIIEYRIKKAGFVSIKVYNLLGSVVATLVDERKAPGIYSVRWTPGNLTSGVYFYQMKSGTFTTTKKLVIIK